MIEAGTIISIFAIKRR